MKKDRLEDLSNDRLLLLVANGGYATHYGFTIGEWLRAKAIVKTTPNLIELNNKLICTPVNMSWTKIS